MVPKPGMKEEREYDSSVGIDLPSLWPCGNGNHAHGCLPVVLRMQGLRDAVETQGRRLLCVLLLWYGEVPAGAGKRSILLRRKQSMNALPETATATIPRRVP